jgi:hypothetical protein
MEGLNVYNEPRALEAERELCEFIGDLSEGVLSCSFNDDEILGLVLKDGLNEQVEWVCKQERDRCMGEIGRHTPPDGDWDAELIRRLTALRGWPEGWYAPLTLLSDLPEHYQRLFRGTMHEHLLTPEVGDTIHLTAYRIEFPTMADALTSGQSVCCQLDEPYLLRRDGKGHMAVHFTVDIDNIQCDVVITHMGNGTTYSSCVVTHDVTKVQYHARVFPQLNVTTPVVV